MLSTGGLECVTLRVEGGMNGQVGLVGFCHALYSCFAADTCSSSVFYWQLSALLAVKLQKGVKRKSISAIGIAAVISPAKWSNVETVGTQLLTCDGQC